MFGFGWGHTCECMSTHHVIDIRPMVSQSSIDSQLANRRSDAPTKAVEKTTASNQICPLYHYVPTHSSLPYTRCHLLPEYVIYMDPACWWRAGAGEGPQIGILQRESGCDRMRDWGGLILFACALQIWNQHMAVCVPWHVLWDAQAC